MKKRYFLLILVSIVILAVFVTTSLINTGQIFDAVLSVSHSPPQTQPVTVKEVVIKGLYLIISIAVFIPIAALIYEKKGVKHDD